MRFRKLIWFSLSLPLPHLDMSAASVRMDARSDRIGAPSQREGSCAIFCNWFGDTCIGGHHWGWPHLWHEFTAFSVGTASIQTRAMHFQWTRFATVRFKMWTFAKLIAPGHNLLTHFYLHCREYLDLKRNQQLLRELVTRRGLPVLDSIPSALQQTRAILDGSNTFILPQNVASRLM